MSTEPNTQEQRPAEASAQAAPEASGRQIRRGTGHCHTTADDLGNPEGRRQKMGGRDSMKNAEETPPADRPNAEQPKRGLQRKSRTPSEAFLAHRFRAGQSGNPSGRRKGACSLKAAVLREATPENVKAVARRLWSESRAGDVAMIKVLVSLLDEAPAGRVDVALSPPTAQVHIDMAAIKERVAAAVEGEERMRLMEERGLVTVPPMPAADVPLDS